MLSRVRAYPGAAFIFQKAEQLFQMAVLGNADDRAAAFFLPDEPHLGHSGKVM